MRRKLLMYLLPLLLVGAVVGAALFLLARPLPVEVARPAENVPIKVFGLGTVEARVISRIGFEVGAALVELNADHGDRVKTGDILARLHDAEQEARVAKSRAGMLSAEAAVKMAEAAVGKARAVLAQKREANARRKTLLARQAISIEAAEEAQRDEDVAAADVDVAISEIAAKKAALEDAKAQFDLERVLLDHHVLKAPYDAIVVQRHKELGSVLIPGEALFTLVAPETVWTLAYIDEERAGGIRLGQPAEARLRSQPQQTFPGRIVRIGIESDRVNEERRVYISCDRCPETFHLGEQAEVLIDTGRLDRALLVPEAAVEGFDGLHGMVWTVENGRLNRRTATFGQKTLDARLEIVGGVPEGARVVAALRSGLREGRAARIAQETAP